MAYSCRKQLWRPRQSEIRVQQIHCCFMKITFMSQQNKLLSHLKMFILEMFTAAAFPREAGMAQGWGAAPSWQWQGWDRAHGSPRRSQRSDARRGRGRVAGALCLTCAPDSVIHWELLCTSLGLWLIQKPGMDHAYPLACPHQQGQPWQSEQWVTRAHISGILYSGCG